MDARQIRNQIETYAKQREQAVRQRDEANRIVNMLDGAIEALGSLANQAEAEERDDPASSN